jgi:hypothetical protein
VVEAAYRALSKKYHPDINRLPEAQERMSQINTAYDILGDSLKRRDYNQLRNNFKPAITASSPSASPSRPPTTTNTTASTGTNGNTTKTYTTSTANPNPNTNASYRTNTTANSAGTTNNSSTANRTQPPYPDSTPRPTESARVEAQRRAKGGGSSRAGHYVYDAKKSWPVGRIMIGSVLVIIGLAVLVLIQENFLGNPLSTHFTTHPTPSETSIVPFEPLQETVPAPTITPTPVPAGANTMSPETVATFLQGPNLFPGRIGNSDITLNNSVLYLKLKLDATVDTNQTLTTLHASETIAYKAIYALFGQFSPQLRHIVIGLTNPTTGQLVYKMDVTREAAFGFYTWQNISTSTSLDDLVQAATEARLANRFGTPQDDKTHTLLITPDENALNAELANWSIEGTTSTLETSGLLYVSYLLNNNPAQQQLDFIKMFYALYTRFPNLDEVELGTALAGQSGGTKVFYNRELFNRIGSNEWARRLSTGDVADLYNSLPKTDTAYKALTANPTYVAPQPANTLLRVRTWQVGIAKVEQSNGVPGYTPSGNNQVLAITVDLTNNGSNTMYPLLDEIFSLYDTLHHVYRLDVAGSVQYNLSSNNPTFTPIPPGQKERLTLIFSLPRTNTPPKLSLQIRDSDVKGQVFLP